MPSLLLGNTDPKTPAPGVVVNNEVDGERFEGKTIVQIDTPDRDLDDNPISLDKQLSEVRFAFGLHSAGDVAWAECEDEFFAEALSRSFGCPIGRPDDWDDETPEEEQAHEDDEAPEEEVEEEQGAAKGSDDELTNEDDMQEVVN